MSRMLWACAAALLIADAPAHAISSAVTQVSPPVPFTQSGSISIEVQGGSRKLNTLIRESVAGRLNLEHDFDPVLPYATNGQTHLIIVIHRGKTVGAAGRVTLGVLAGGSSVSARVTVMHAGAKVNEFDLVAGTKTATIFSDTNSSLGFEFSRALVDQVRKGAAGRQ
ncbi:hypothetical protein EIK56_17955 [Sphingomonas sp. C8-2]|nr:hypothetical protein EIK56_17955 [Sphingomonas sp. C8-2]